MSDNYSDVVFDAEGLDGGDSGAEALGDIEFELEEEPPPERGTKRNAEVEINLGLAKRPKIEDVVVRKEPSVLPAGLPASVKSMVNKWAGYIATGLACFTYRSIQLPMFWPVIGSSPKPVPPVVTPSDEGVKIQQLKTLAALRDSGALTEKEFQAEKRRVLDGG